MRLCVCGALFFGCAASYSPAPLEAERPIAELSEGEWRALCQWVNSRRPSTPRGVQECVWWNSGDGLSAEYGRMDFEAFGDFCELRDRVGAETVGELSGVVECHSNWRERRAEYLRGAPSGCGCGGPPRVPESEDPMIRFCPILPCEILPTVFLDGRGECYDGGPACAYECGCTCGAGPRECGD